MPLPGDVGDEHAEPAGAERKEVVVVPADLARGDAERRHAEARHVELAARQERHLDLPRDAQLFFEPLLLGRRLEQVLDAAGHLVERPGELAQLVLGVDVDAVREVALPDALGAHEELVDRARDRARERQPHDERDELDDEEEDRDDDEDEPEGVADRDVPCTSIDCASESRSEELAHPERERDRGAERLARRPVVRVEEAHRVAEERESARARRSCVRRRSPAPAGRRWVGSSVTPPAFTPVRS